MRPGSGKGVSGKRISPALCRVLACLALAVAVVGAASTAANAAERSLAGIRIFMPVKVILQRFGDPTYISTGASVATFVFQPGHMDVIPPSGTVGGQGPGMRGGPGGAGPYMSNAGPGEAFTSADISRYDYVFPKNLAYEFVLSPNGRVLSIKVFGFKSSVRTSRGIGLGSTYADVVEKYGYPEDHSLTGQSGGEPILTASYTNRDHVDFQFVDDKVVGIIVSAAE